MKHGPRDGSLISNLVLCSVRDTRFFSFNDVEMNWILNGFDTYYGLGAQIGDDSSLCLFTKQKILLGTAAMPSRSRGRKI